MPVGSHKDAFKAHQVVKRLVAENTNPLLARLAGEILLDFVKNQRQIRSEAALGELPEDRTPYEEAQLDKALRAVEGLCGKCEESHDDGCFVNQARRTLIAAKTGVDLGAGFDGKKTLEELLEDAARRGQASLRGCTEEVAVAAPALDEGVAGEWRRRYEELREQDVFRATLIDEVVETIASVTKGNFAAEMPVHDDVQLAKLATAFNLMLRNIHETMGSLDRLVAERSAEMRMIMDSVPVGLLTVNEALRIQPEYSKACEAILGLDNLRGRDFLDALGLTRRRADDRAQVEDFLDVMRRGLLSEDQLAFLNPFPELELPSREGGRPTWVRVQYRLIERGGGPAYVLVLLEDVTESKALQHQVEQSERQNTQLKVIAEDPDLFCEFLREARGVLQRAETVLTEIPSAQDARALVNERFRGVHTIKGTAGAMGLASVSGLASPLEDRLSELRNASEFSLDTLQETRVSLEQIRAAVEESVRDTEKLLGQSIEGGKGMVLRVDSAEILRHIEAVGDLPLAPEHKADVLGRFKELRRVDAKRGLGRSLKVVPALAQRLGKEVDFSLEDGGVRLDCDVSQELNGPLVHLLRNAFDHGIEPEEERVMDGKTPQGKVTLAIRSAGSGLTLMLSDDGKGLDPAALRASAVKKGLLTPEAAAALTDAESRGLIFRPGFSTAESVTDVSGRGVGMDAVLSSVRDRLGGEILVDSLPGRGTTFTIEVPENGPLLPSSSKG